METLLKLQQVAATARSRGGWRHPESDFISTFNPEMVLKILDAVRLAPELLGGDHHSRTEPLYPRLKAALATLGVRT